MLTLDEAEVLEILVRLPRLIFESEAPKPFPFTWGTKRRRSAIDVAPSPSRLRFRLRLPPFTTPSPLHPATDGASGGGGGGGGPTSDTDSLPPVKAEASSPATPLSFSPSESDEKPIVLKKKIPLKRVRFPALFFFFLNFHILNSFTLLSYGFSMNFFFPFY